MKILNYKMYESKHHRVSNEEKHTRSSHTLIDKTLLKSMQADITHASDLIIALRDEKEKLKKALSELQQENHEKTNMIRNLRNKIKYMENYEEDDEIIKELSQANLKLKNEIEISMHGGNAKHFDSNSEIISLTKVFLNKIHDKTKHYQIFKSHMKSSNDFKQVIGNENWAHATLLLLRFYKDLFSEDDHKVTIALPEGNSEESEQENYANIIQSSKHLLDTLSYQKSKLENLNKEYSSRASKMSPAGSPIYRGNITTEKSLNSPELKKETSQLSNFHTANKLAKNVSRFKQVKK